MRACRSGPIRSADQLVFEAGLWLSGLESFLTSWNHIARDSQQSPELAEDWTKEFRLTHSALLICSSLNYELRRSLSAGSRPAGEVSLDAVAVDDCDEFILVLRDLITLNSNFIKADSLKFDAWKSWSALLIEKLRGSETVRRFVALSERDGLAYLPPDLQKLLEVKQLSFSDRADLYAVLSRFAVIMRSLSVVGSMLRRDEPLKTTVLIFAKVHEQSQELINFINNRLARFKDEAAELFASLDSAILHRIAGTKKGLSAGVDRPCRHQAGPVDTCKGRNGIFSIERWLRTDHRGLCTPYRTGDRGDRAFPERAVKAGTVAEPSQPSLENASGGPNSREKSRQTYLG